MTRRDKIFLVGQRAELLNKKRSAAVWQQLARALQALGETDLPKFRHLLRAIRISTIDQARS